MPHWKVGSLVRRSAHQLRENTAVKPATGIVTDIYTGPDTAMVLQRWPYVHWHGSPDSSLCHPDNVEVVEEPTIQRDRLNEVSKFLHTEYLRTDHVAYRHAGVVLDEVIASFPQ